MVRTHIQGPYLLEQSMIIVEPIDKEYQIKMKHEDNEVIFTFRQLTYNQKAEIAAATTRMHQGRVVQDFTLNSFLTVKKALVDVDGLHCLVKGKEQEYKLTMDDNGEVSEKNLNELFNTPFSENLVHSALQLSQGIPDKIVHPITRQAIEGVEIVYPKGTVEKKS